MQIVEKDTQQQKPRLAIVETAGDVEWSKLVEKQHKNKTGDEEEEGIQCNKNCIGRLVTIQRLL